MSWIVRNIDWVLILSGAATCSMLLMALAPHWAMRFIFGDVAEGPVAQLIARSWGAMIFASGLMLIYAALHPDVRLPVLLYSIAGKLGFVILVLANRDFRTGRAMPMAVGDLLIVVLLSWYLLAS